MKSEVISSLKNRYSHIYSVSSGDTEYLFRALTLKEVRLVEEFISLKIKTSSEIEDFCLETCLLFPENIDLDDILPGTAIQLAEEILKISGIADAEYIIQSMQVARSRLENDIILDIKSYIISAMPQYNDDDLNRFTLLELIEKLVLSEKILTLQANLSGFDQKIELTFGYADQEGQEEYELVKKPTGKTSQNLPDKETLIRRIRKDNVDRYSSRGHYHNPDAAEEWQGFDTEILAKMEGNFDPNDPIARKLHGM